MGDRLALVRQPPPHGFGHLGRPGFALLVRAGLARRERLGQFAPVAIQRVAGSASCTGPGWFVDASMPNPVVMLCPDSCGLYRTDVGSEIEVRREYCE